MSFRCGIIGLPNVGKSTIFNALTKAHAAVANYPFTTVNFNKGVVAGPDKRLTDLAQMFKPQKTTLSSIEFFDIAGLVKDAHKGEGLGNQFLSHISEVEAICHVVRCFRDDNVSHVYSDLEPMRDIEIFHTELLLKDFETIEKRIKKTEPLVRSGDKKAKEMLVLYNKIKNSLEKGTSVKNILLEREEKDCLKDISFLTEKVVLYIANVRDDELPHGGPFVKALCDYAHKQKMSVVILSAKIEEEIAELSGQEKKPYLESYGLNESALTQLIAVSYQCLDLITFFTVVGPEVRAWTVRHGTRAPQAAGKIHTDFERGFISCDVVSYNDLMACGSWNAAREAGHLRHEGRNYPIHDGDVCHFKFNV